MRRLAAGLAMGLVLAAGLARGEGLALEGWLAEEGFWGQETQAFAERGKGFGFVLAGDGQTAQAVREGVTFLGHRVWEARTYFAGDKVARVELSLFNKGDAGELSREGLTELAAAAGASLEEWTGAKGFSGTPSRDRANHRVERRQWRGGAVAAELSWAYVEGHRSGGKNVPFRSEFVKVTLVPAAGTEGAAAREKPEWAVQTSARSIKANVKRDEAGDVWVDGVPMVDQGQKGYCAAATGERILRYYGRKVDQHEMAQLADTAASGGTTSEGMTAALRAIGRKYQLDEKELVKGGGGERFEKSRMYETLTQYNRVAKQQGAAEINYENYTSEVARNQRMIDSRGILAAMDADIMKAARARNKQGLENFRKQIAAYVGQGVPLAWACIVGKYPETPAAVSTGGIFGHMRLIIGYNTKTGEVLYSDSWGKGHELKRLPLEEAWAMTEGLTVLKPRGVR